MIQHFHDHVMNNTFIILIPGLKEDVGGPSVQPVLPGWDTDP